MLPPFCYLVRNIGISIEYTSYIMRISLDLSFSNGKIWRTSFFLSHRLGLGSYLHFEFPRGSLLDGSIKTHGHHLDATNQILSSDL